MSMISNVIFSKMIKRNLKRSQIDLKMSKKAVLDNFQWCQTSLFGNCSSGEKGFGLSLSSPKIICLPISENCSLNMIFRRSLLLPSEGSAAFAKCFHGSICRQNMKPRWKLVPRSMQCLGSWLLPFLLRDTLGMILELNQTKFKTPKKAIFVFFFDK